MNFKNLFRLSFLLLALSLSEISNAQNSKSDGYKGIWFTLGQFSEFGDKYSGGLGTYTANHIPMTIYAPEVKKTFLLMEAQQPKTKSIC
ncbi:MAG: hypothetical protein K0M40_01375 [Prolixibacteraceae bacterium]|nr:hypothetical protein [Prolixibacteraceae bacterium]